MKHLYSFVCPICLGKADSLRRTNTCACAALCASISINHVALCTLRDSLNGALTSTCSTRNATHLTRAKVQLFSNNTKL